MSVLARTNPFRAERIHSLKFRFHNDTWEQVLRRLELVDFRGAVVGPQGSGKTTFLFELGRQLQVLGHATQYFCIGQDKELNKVEWSKLANLQPGLTLLVDGTEILGPLRWYQFGVRTQTARAVIITRHAPCRWPTILSTHTTPALVADLITELLGSRLDPPDNDEVKRLFEIHRGDARQILRACYDSYSV